MDALDAIHTRRSIRKFTDKHVSNELIEKILAAGMSAPSANNNQSWYFVVVRDKDVLKQIAYTHKYAKMCLQANVAILVCGDSNCGEYSDFWVQDCSACTQNMLLAIHALGLGGVWVGLYPRDSYVTFFKKLFHLPKTIMPLCLIPLGYTSQKGGRIDRFKKDKIHTERW